MSRLNQAELTAAAVDALDAEPDPSGAADLVFSRGSVMVVAEVSEFKATFKRIKKIDGYRWVVINREDLFAANTLSLGSKAGIIDANGSVLKQADVPRSKI